MEQPSPTARVILGFLAAGDKSGYDIKSMTDRSTRFFWAASYGQIYPELKRLAETGLVEAAEESEGGRQRTAWAITDAGREALAGWVESEGIRHELRDEGSLKVFFAALVGPEAVEAALTEKRDHHTAELAKLEEIRPFAATAERYGPAEVLEYGISLHTFAKSWCEAQLEQIDKES